MDIAFDYPTVPQGKGEPLRWRHLTKEERELIANGCAAKGHWFDPPDWIFTASCNIHDLNYWLGGTEEDRYKADHQFYKAMLRDASDAPWWKRWWYKFVAWVYYLAVRWRGAEFFHYGPEKTRADLERELRDMV